MAEPMTTPDPTAVREAAGWLKQYELGRVDIDQGDPIIAGLACADFVEFITDLTPLSVEGLVGMGGKLDGETTHWNGFEILMPFPESTTWRWWYHGSRQHHPPRTAGELRQIIMRLEPPHAR